MLRFVLIALASDYGLFLSDEDPRKGIWLESGRTLDYYMLRNGVNISMSSTQHTYIHTQNCSMSPKTVKYNEKIKVQEKVWCE